MKTSDLISKLSLDAKITKTLAPFPRRFAIFCLSTLAFALSFVGFKSLNSHSLKLVSDLDLWVNTLVPLILFILASYKSFSMSVPGAETNRKNRMLSLVLVLLWLGFVWLRKPELWTELSSGGLTIGSAKCGLFIFIFSALPLLSLAYLIRKALPLELFSSSIFIALSAGSISAFIIELECPEAHPAHWLLGHLIPAAVLTYVGAQGVHRFLRKRTKEFCNVVKAS